MNPASGGQFFLQQAYAATVCFCMVGFAAAAYSAEPLAGAAVTAGYGPASIPLTTATQVEQKPLWKELTPSQQEALKPLAPHWNNINEFQKRKWLAMSVNFGKMSPTEQANLHERMLDWGALSAAQRSQARLNFAETKRLAPTEKKAKWEAYQTLAPEEKQKLAKQAPAKLPGAATAVRPVAPQKLATVPAERKNVVKSPSIATEAHQIDPKTLLPLRLQRVGLDGAAGSNAPKATPQ